MRRNKILIITGFVVEIALMSIIYSVAFINLNTISGKLDYITDTATPIVSTGDDHIITLLRANSIVHEYIHERDIRKLEKLENEFGTTIKRNKMIGQKLFELSADNHSLQEQIHLAMSKIKKFETITYQIFNKYNANIGLHVNISFNRLIRKLDSNVKETVTIINNITRHTSSILNDADKSTRESIYFTKTLINIIFIILFCIGLIVSIVVVNIITGAEKEMKTAFMEIDHILNTATSGMWVFDGNGTIINVNERMLQFLNASKSEILNKNITEIKNKFLGLDILTSNNSERVNTDSESEITIKKGDNNTITLLVKKVPFPLKEGNANGTLENYTDISDKKKTEIKVMNAIEDERKKIGRDIHDVLGQKLTGLSYINQGVANMLRNEKPNEMIKEEIQKSGSVIASLIQYSKYISKGLNPVNLDKYGLIAAVQEILSDFEYMYNVNFDTGIDHSIEISDRSVRTNIFYIIKEALNNAVKYGDGRQYAITLCKHRKKIYINIINSMQPLDEYQNINYGLGIQIMQYRAGIIGAEFNISIDNDTFSIFLSAGNKNT